MCMVSSQTSLVHVKDDDLLGRISRICYYKSLKIHIVMAQETVVFWIDVVLLLSQYLFKYFFFEWFIKVNTS